MKNLEKYFYQKIVSKKIMLLVYIITSSNIKIYVLSNE